MSIDPVQASTFIFDIARGFMRSQVLRTACDLRLFDHLDESAKSANAIAEEIGVPESPCVALLRAVAHLGLCEMRDDRFAANTISQYLRSTHPMHLQALANSDFYRPLWNCLTNAVREGSPRWLEAYGSPAELVFTTAYADPARAKSIAEFFSAVSVPQGIAVARSWDFSLCSKLLDVGGGGGSITIEILKANPHLHGTVVDLPPMVAAAQQNIAANGVSDRCEAVVGDMFGELPPGHDAILLAWVLHDWSDTKCDVILRRCHNALVAGGRLLICEAVLNDDGTGTDDAVLGSLNMLVNAEPGAKERTLSEFAQLLKRTGFRIEQLIRTGGARDMIIASKL